MGSTASTAAAAAGKAAPSLIQALHTVAGEEALPFDAQAWVDLLAVSPKAHTVDQELLHEVMRDVGPKLGAGRRW